MTGSIYNNNNNNCNEEVLDLLIKPTIKSTEIVVEHPKKKTQQFLLCISDIILSMIVIGPCTVGFWRGLWMLMDIYYDYFPKWETYLFGTFICLVFCVLQDYLNEISNTKQQSKCRYLVITRIYLYIFTVVTIMCWRGIWLIFDTYLNFDNNIRTKYITIILIVTLLILVLTKTVVNICGAPFTITLDQKDAIFTVPTRYRQKMNDRISLYILDCLFSVLVIGTLVVFVWRGGWALLDIYLFPDDEILSAWGSLIVGYTTVIIAFTIQPLVKWLCDRLNGIARLLVADFFLIFSLIGTLNVWRGIWNLLNLYLLPDNVELSCWLTHWVCLIVLILLGCSNSLLVRGVYIDCEEPAGQCVVFPCYYLRIIFKKKLINQIQQPQQKELNEIKEKNKAELISIKINDTNHIINVVNDELTTPTTTNVENSHYKDKV